MTVVRHQPVGAHRGQRHAGHAERQQHDRREVEEDERGLHAIFERPGVQHGEVDVEGRHVAARQIDEHIHRRRPARVQDHLRAIELQKRQVDVRTRWLAQPQVLDIRRDADDGAPLTRADTNPLADRVSRRRPRTARAIVLFTIATGAAVSSSWSSNARPRASAMRKVLK